MRNAFKEWAVIVEALGRGDQILVLRKGGIAEGRGGFQVEHPDFLLFPTMFHQQRESVIPSAQVAYDQLARLWPAPDRFRIAFWARVADWKRVDHWHHALALRGQHVWKDEVIRDRFSWGRDQNIFALALRVYRLAAPVDLAMDPSYGGCKSWIELAEEVDVAGSVPVLSEPDFAKKVSQFADALEGATPPQPT